MVRLLGFIVLAVVSTGPMQAQAPKSRPEPRPSEKMNDRGAQGILVPGKPWEILGGGYHLAADSAVDSNGNVYFTDARKNRILKLDLEGKIDTWKEGSNGTHGVAFGPDGRL